MEQLTSPNLPEIVIEGLWAIVAAFVSAMVITWYYIPKVIRVVRQRHLEDKPGDHKIHNGEIPTLGGIGIFAGFIFGYLIGVDGNITGLSYFTAATVMLFFVGVKDDLIYLHPKKKLIGELGSALVIVLFTDLRITNLHGFLGFTDISALGSYFVTISVMLLIINAVNLIDGIDGLAASVGIIASLAFGAFFYLSGDNGYAAMAAALLGALIAFIRFNITDGPNKIFMGDTGSLVIGFTLAVFAIRFNYIEAEHASFISLRSTPALSVAILIVPLFDTFRIILVRLSNHQRPYVADKRHIHHLMLRAGFSHREATLYISLFNISLITIVFLLDRLGIFLLGLLMLALCSLATLIIIGAVRRREAGRGGSEV
ncbi:MAG: undecaprenyl/decaprenyl-phosphate alpha-N-acetylglucosaminyl 1-phosphate transferase [Bacteroidales bacterium]|jgi:UDP-N-acetylmuramyl pentapeptide phosphotransferase/UDP-N-acetylglucosamine-1-phosphate transferase|nr:undecaprenyl/decaprenyl-phosphate alpha-N-acetylglucosaminyl 1-phosphate transferase [Bacteroidales bacterium]